MSQIETRRRPAQATRRFGYTVSVTVNAALLFGVNQWPGWDVLPFLTPATQSVVGWVNASIIVGVAANLVFLLSDPPALKALGDLFTTVVGVAALLRIWQVFPFDFVGDSIDWALVVRILLGVGIFGSGVGIVAAVVTFVRSVAPRTA